jgi:lipoate-protein ligase B
MSGTLTVCALGPTPYREGLALQDALVRARANGETGDWLLYPDHPPVLTVGRSGSDDSLLVGRDRLAARGIEVFEVPRGGDVTWHGPGQVVGYPIVGLDRVDRDLHRWLRTLEEALIRTMARWGVAGERWPGRTGIWIADSAWPQRRKIASLGVAVRRWVGYHGLAWNVCPDLAGFSLIHPCGLQGVQMTRMADLLGERSPSLADARRALTEELVALLGYGAVIEADPEAARAFQREGEPADNSTVETHPGPQTPF